MLFEPGERSIDIKAGMALYKKQGFEIEGVRRQALVVNNHYVDEYYMAKLLDES